MESARMLHDRKGSILRKRKWTLCPLLGFLTIALFFGTVVTAIMFWDTSSAPQTPTVEALSASVQVIKALEQAIDNKEVREKVRKTLENVSADFQPCLYNVYRCDATGTITEVILDGINGGRVNWTQLPATVKRIYVRNSVLQQSLVMTELPLQLEEFSAINTHWQPKSLHVHPFNALPVNGVLPMPCSPNCIFRLMSLMCESCGLTAAHIAKAAPLFPNLTSLHLNNNSLLTFDVSEVPPSVTSLQLSHTRLGELTVADILTRTSKKLNRLNISFTGVTFEWSMLAAAPQAMKILDLSGLAPVTVITERNGVGFLTEAPPKNICNSGRGMDLRELYFSNSGITSGLPDFKGCTSLDVLDVSHNRLTKLDLDKLPNKLTVLHLNSNDLSDELDVAKLPRSLHSLDLSSNRLRGSINISALPPQLQYFDVSNNTFSGHVNLTQLPETLKFVYLQHNNFTGEADLVNIPLGIRYIMIHHNNWDYRLPAE